MSILVISLAIIVALALPWWLGGVVRLSLNADLQTVCEKNIAKNYAINFAYGVVVMAYLFVLLTVFPDGLAHTALSNFGLIVVLTTLLLTIALAFTRRQQLEILYKQLKNNDQTTLLLALGLVFSVYAIFAHPYVHDSAQLHSVAQYVNPLNEFHAFDRGMIGYSATVLSIATFFTDHPLAFIASSLKAPLGIIFFAGLTLFARYFKTLNYYYALCILVVIFISSTLGLYGFVTLGKDSIIGVAFMWLFFSLWLTQPSSESSKVTDLDLAVVLLAAATTGIITVPYVFAFFVVLALSNTLDICLWRFTSLFLAIGGIPLSTALSIIIRLPSWQLLVVIWSLSIALYIITHKVLEGRELKIGLGGSAIQFIPLVCLISLIVIFPLSTNTIDVVFNAQWPSLKSPLDDKTEFLPGLLYAHHTESVMSIYLFVFGWAGVCIWAFIDKSPAVRSIAAMPFVILLFSALHVEFDWHIIRYRLLWDLYKDIPQWVSGLYVGLGILAITTLLLKLLPRGKPPYTILTVLTVSLSLFPMDRPVEVPLGSYLLPVATFNSVAGHKDKLLAQVIKYNFENPKAKFVLFQKEISYGSPSFSKSYGYESYGYQYEKDKIMKRVASKEMGLICFHRKKKQDVIEFTSESVFSVKKANIIQTDRHVCDQLVRN